MVLFALIFGGIGGSLLYFSSAATGGTLVGTVAPATLQPSDIGKTIYSLHAWQNKIYPGYGDYSANSGPITLFPYNTQTKTFASEGTASTEAIYIYRELAGKLYAPAIDSKGADLTYNDGQTTWTNVSGVGTTHAFDMAELDGKLWLAGSLGKVATVWSSADGGTTWQTALSIPAEQVGAVARFYFIASYKGKLYVQATDGASPHSTAYSYDPAVKTWEKAATITQTSRIFDWGRKPIEFAGNLLLLGREVISGPSGIIRYDGTARTSQNEYTYAIGGSYYDYTVADGYLYVLSSDGQVRRTKDLVSWETIGTGPKTSRTSGAGRSIAVLNNKVYIGTVSSTIYELTIPSTTTGTKPGPKR